MLKTMSSFVVAFLVAVAVTAGPVGNGTNAPHLTAALAPAVSGSGVVPVSRSRTVRAQ